MKAICAKIKVVASAIFDNDDEEEEEDLVLFVSLFFAQFLENVLNLF